MRRAENGMQRRSMANLPRVFAARQASRSLNYRCTIMRYPQCVAQRNCGTRSSSEHIVLTLRSHVSK